MVATQLQVQPASRAFETVELATTLDREAVEGSERPQPTPSGPMMWLASALVLSLVASGCNARVIAMR